MAGGASGPLSETARAFHRNGTPDGQGLSSAALITLLLAPGALARDRIGVITVPVTASPCLKPY